MLSKENMAGVQIHERTISISIMLLILRCLLFSFLFIAVFKMVPVYVIKHPSIRNHTLTKSDTFEESLWRSMMLTVV